MICSLNDNGAIRIEARVYHDARMLEVAGGLAQQARTSMRAGVEKPAYYPVFAAQNNYLPATDVYQAEIAIVRQFSFMQDKTPTAPKNGFLFSGKNLVIQIDTVVDEMSCR